MVRCWWSEEATSQVADTQTGLHLLWPWGQFQFEKQSHSHSLLSQTDDVTLPHESETWCYPIYGQRKSCLLCEQTPPLRCHRGTHQYNIHHLPLACDPSDPASFHSEEDLMTKEHVRPAHSSARHKKGVRCKTHKEEQTSPTGHNNSVVRAPGRGAISRSWWSHAPTSSSPSTSRELNTKAVAIIVVTIALIHSIPRIPAKHRR